MQLEDYFDFDAPNRVKLKGHRVWIEHILEPYIYRRKTAEQIAHDLSTLRMDEIYAAILYFHQHEEEMTLYMANWLELCRTQEAESRQKYAVFYEKMRRLRAEKERETEQATVPS